MKGFWRTAYRKKRRMVYILRGGWLFFFVFFVFFALPASASLLYPTQGFFSDPWDTQALVPPPGQYRAVPGPHLQIRRIKVPPTAVLKRLRTLPALTAWALAHNPQTASAWADLAAQAAALGYAKGLWLPSISGQVQGQRSETLYSTSLLNAPAVNGLYSSLSFSEVLFDFGYRQASVQAARSTALAARYSANETLQTIALNVADAYYGLAETLAIVETYRQGVREAQKIYQDTRTQYRAHLKAVTDVFQAQTELALAREDLASAQGSLQASRAQLAESVGLPVSVRLHIPPLFTPQAPHAPTVTHWLHQAYHQNPAIQADLESMAATRHNIAVAKAQGLPSVSLVGNLGKDWFHKTPNQESFSVGLQLNVPLDANFQHQYQVQKERALYRQAHAQARQEVQSVFLQVWQAYYRWQSSYRAYQAAQSQVHSAEKALSGIRTQYRIGLANILDLVTAEENLISARVTKTEELAAYYQYQASLYRYVGVALH